ncbi:MAG: hypothetical protein DRR19_32850 [Candidatus Parabeggiatoa sp. nov. 1]|nr:MAG: hypothetical protein DRR19_32850 [Gammaproteobacteria bacterium]
MKEFKDLLNEYMQCEGFNDESLAKALSLVKELRVSKTTIYNWRTGKVEKIKCEKIKKCAELLKLSPVERRDFLVAAGCLPAENGENAPLVPIINIPINHPHQFFGREKELKRIFGRWKHIPLHNVAVYGERRSGKTSLLHYIKNIHTAAPLRDGQRNDWQPSGYQFVFVNFEGAGMCEEEKLLHYIFNPP